MGEFKVGDRVRATVDSAYSVKKGDVCTVTEILNENAIRFRKPDGTVDGWGSENFELVEQHWQPKVGDRVRYSDGMVSGEGIVHSHNDDDDLDPGLAWTVEVERKDLEFAYYVNETCRKFDISSLSPLPVAAEAQPAALQIQAGKFYRTRDGRKVGPMETFLNMFSAEDDGTHRIFQADGTHGSQHVTNLPHLDLIAEWVDTVAVAATASNDNEPKSTTGFTIPIFDTDGAKLVKTKNGYGFEIARFGNYAWVDTGQTAPITLKVADIAA